MKFLCSGFNCPSANICTRHTMKSAKGYEYAALWARREPGASACSEFLSNQPSTFEAKPFRGESK